MKMSTRSGKRIHKSFQEDVLNGAADDGSKTERKTRSRRLKENCDALNVTLSATKKRKNYVTYSSNDEHDHDAGDAGPSDSHTVRSDINNTLKELNVEVIAKSTLGNENNFVAVLKDKPVVRETRRTKRFVANGEEENAPVTGGDITLCDTYVFETKKAKKSKKRKSKQDEVVIDNNIKENEKEERQVPQKKSKSKKKGKRQSSSMIVEDILPFGAEKQRSLHSANTSADSYHTATESPDTKDNSVNVDGHVQDLNVKSDKSPVDRDIPVSNKDEHKSILDKLTEIQLPSTSKSLNSSVVTSSRKRTRNHTAGKDITFNKSPEPEVLANGSKKFDSTFDKDDYSNNSSQKLLNRTWESNSITRKSVRVSNATEKNSSRNLRKSLSSTFDKLDTSKTHSTAKSLDGTFDKSMDNNTTPHSNKHDSTFDKSENNSAAITENAKMSRNNNSDKSARSSIISSDGTVNVTFDKSDKNLSRISVTSDESKTENLLNTTPVLIESSMETTDLSESSLLLEPTGKPTAVAITPLKREGTFTKDGPDPIIIMSPLPRTSIDDSVRTPTRRKMSLPSPGCTPYHSNTKPSQKQSLLNVTRSIEKGSSSLGPVRTTRVMFYSPVDDPALNTLRKSKVIKSSMKGSNKSFLFEEKGSRPAPRKRSYTASDADEVRAKRSCLTADLQQSVNRLSRPRTSSATASPLPKPATPARSRSESKRVKLPNFAALHRKEFSRMESLDECQRRRARRARQLLVPTGGLQVLERASPKLTPAEPPKSATREKETRKQHTPSKDKVPALESATEETETKQQQNSTKTKQTPLKAKAPAPDAPKPGYSRFGFKLNLNGNPFSIPSKTPNQKPTENEPNGILKKQATQPSIEPSGLPKRQATQPSVAGVTGVRREVAKQVIMREKSAAYLKEKRDAKRKESRTIIKGVRTNRRFELQMRSRNING